MLKRFSFVIFLGLIGGVAFSSWFGFTKLYFFDGELTGSALDMEIRVGTGSSGFWIDVSNPASQQEQLKIKFVSQILTPDGKVSCDMVSGNVFGDLLSWDLGSFSVNPDTTVRHRVDFNFPVCSSGVFLGCAVQIPATEQSIGSFDVVAGKANFLRLLVHPSDLCMPFTIKVFPGSRPGADFANIGELRFYDTSNVLQYTGLVSTNQAGTGVLADSLPSGIYYAVYKGQSQLASYLSGVEILTGGEVFLDFTTGTNLYNTQNKSISQDDASQYQIAGDLKNIIGNYDFMINGNDIAILTASGFIDSGVPVLEPKNLNGDAAINVSDISIVGINFERTDPFLSTTKFVW